jgi:hypothetical protein
MHILIRRPAFLAAEVMLTHPLGKRIVIKPRDNLKGIGVSYTLDTLALVSRHMGWLTVTIPNTKELVRNTEYLENNSRDPFFFDQPQVAKRFLEELINANRPILERWYLKEEYSMESHAYTVEDFLKTRDADYAPLGLGERVAPEAEVEEASSESEVESEESELEEESEDEGEEGQEEGEEEKEDENEESDVDEENEEDDERDHIKDTLNQGNVLGLEDVLEVLKTSPVVPAFFRKEATAEDLAREYYKRKGFEIVGDEVQLLPDLDIPAADYIKMHEIDETAEDSESKKKVEESISVDGVDHYGDAKFEEAVVAASESDSDLADLDRGLAELGDDDLYELDPLLTEDRYTVTEYDLNQAAEEIASLVYDSHLNPAWKDAEVDYQRDQDVINLEKHPVSLYDLAKFGLQDESEKHICNVAIDILSEIRNNKEYV